MSKAHLQAREEQYRTYLATCAQLIAESTARFAGGRALNQSYMDLIQKRSKTTPQRKEERSPEQIAADILAALHS